MSVVKGKSTCKGYEGENVPMGVKRGLRNSILLPKLIYGSERLTRNRVSKVHAVEITYLRGIWSDKMGQ